MKAEPVEYHTFYHWEDLPLRRGDLSETIKDKSLDDRLNDLAAQGWRFVAATACQHRNGFLIVMERIKQ